MGLSIGIVGLPNVGKSTLYNALTKNKAEASNYPFCTIDPNIGIVPVPDERLEKLATVVKTEKIVPAVIEFVDIAGIVAGASRGEGLGNKFLSHIRECDAIAEVVRDFKNSNVTHVSGDVNPSSDIETIKTELILADLETMQKKLVTIEKESKRDPKKVAELVFTREVFNLLEKGTPAREVKIDSEFKESWLRSFQLISAKPHIYILNVDEESLKDKDSKNFGEDCIKICAKTEAELAELSDSDKDEYLREIGVAEPGLNTLVRKAYALLGLQSFFTAGEKEARAWTIKRGSTAPQAAGVIHTDFEKGFIKADVVNWEDLVNNNGWTEAKTAGKVRLEGREYICQDGDVMIFKFSN